MPASPEPGAGAAARACVCREYHVGEPSWPTAAQSMPASPSGWSRSMSPTTQASGGAVPEGAAQDWRRRSMTAMRLGRRLIT